MKNFEDVYVVIAPSGTGKTTLNRKLIKENPDDIEMSISYTTRPIRQGEVNGEHYHFVTTEKFKELVHQGQMLEWAEVHKNYYGTPITEIERIRSHGKKTLLEIDLQGWFKAREILPGAQSIFIMPPSMEVMWERLEKRGTDNLVVRLIRLNSAKAELLGAETCDHFIINDQIDVAYNELKDCIISSIVPKLKKESAIEIVNKFLAKINDEQWLKNLR